MFVAGLGSGRHGPFQLVSNIISYGFLRPEQSSADSYSEGSFEGYFGSLDALNRFRWDARLPVLQLRCNIDCFPFYWGLPIPLVNILQ